MIKIDDVKTIDDVIREFDEVITWTIEAKTTIGYFAVIYKNATIAIRDAIIRGDFDDPDRMLGFQLTFARRYFRALNAYNDYGDFVMPTHVWAQSFNANAKNQPIIFQHLLTGLNAHMNLDLGIATADAGRDSMPSLRRDFETVNAVLGYQVEGVLEAIAKISPVIGRMLGCIVGEVEMFRMLIVLFREKAWRFAKEIAENPSRKAELIATHDAQYVQLGMRYIYTPDMFDFLVNAIANEESRDIAENIRVLDEKLTPRRDEIEEYNRNLNEVAKKTPIDEDDFLDRCLETLRGRALAFLNPFD
jgi:hypothetical protein